MQFRDPINHSHSIQNPHTFAFPKTMAKIIKFSLLSVTVLLFLSLLSISLASSPPSTTSSSTTTYNYFLECISNQTRETDISSILYSPSTPKFSSVLDAYIRNERFLSNATRKPLLIVTPTEKAHAAAAVVCAKNLGIQLKVRSGGHDYDGLSYISDRPFVMLDMFNLRTVDFDVQSLTVYVEAGATLGELYYGIWNKSKVHGFPAGVCPTVGIGGHVSGGGYGSMLRKYGLSIDHVIDAEIVDVNGRILDRKSMGEDLFWAIRGGGGASFGVVLSFTVNVVPVPETVTVFSIQRFLTDNATDLVYKWQTVMQDIDHDLFIRLLLQPVTDQTTKTLTVRVTFISLFLGGADRLVSVMAAGFPELNVLKSDCTEMSWAESVLFWSNYDNGTPVEVLLNRTYDSGYLKRKSDYVQEPISKDGLELLWKKLIELGKPGLVFNSYGGIMKEIPATATAFPHRAGNLYKIQYSTTWHDATEASAEKYLGLIRELHSFMTPYVSKNPRGAYLNYRDVDIGVNHNGTYQEGEVYGKKYFMVNFDRLVKVKTTIDPDNFFRYEQSIPILDS
ncbi:hypothetical protein Nepgr_027898 [Nepenthes gracilis]|uniref:FAD-binding PCMH-type domain-containing protein n=1 Tax=Nepenthes gracilis TaxID=150966 RepID=A0AAD3Y3E5_NEPGR|nr:hypothetical protein Nepgr_027898 [Nepenthes gracilis]